MVSNPGAAAMSPATQRASRQRGTRNAGRSVHTPERPAGSARMRSFRRSAIGTKDDETVDRHESRPRHGEQRIDLLPDAQGPTAAKDIWKLRSSPRPWRPSARMSPRTHSAAVVGGILVHQMERGWPRSSSGSAAARGASGRGGVGRRPGRSVPALAERDLTLRNFRDNVHLFVIMNASRRRGTWRQSRDLAQQKGRPACSSSLTPGITRRSWANGCKSAWSPPTWTPR